MLVIFVVWIVFICLNKNELEAHKKYAKKDYCSFVMHSRVTKILEFNQHQNSYPRSYFIYENLGSLIKETDGGKK